MVTIKAHVIAMDITRGDIVNDWNFKKEFRDQHGREYSSKGNAFFNHGLASEMNNVYLNFRIPRPLVRLVNTGRLELGPPEADEVVYLSKYILASTKRVRGVTDESVRFTVDASVTNSKVSRNTGACILVGDFKALQNL